MLGLSRALKDMYEKKSVRRPSAPISNGMRYEPDTWSQGASQECNSFMSSDFYCGGLGIVRNQDLIFLLLKSMKYHKMYVI